MLGIIKKNKQIKKLQNEIEKYKKNLDLLIIKNGILKTKMRDLNKQNNFLMKRDNDLQTLSQMIVNKAKIADIRKYVEEMK